MAQETSGRQPELDTSPQCGHLDPDDPSFAVATLGGPIRLCWPCVLDALQEAEIGVSVTVVRVTA